MYFRPVLCSGTVDQFSLKKERIYFLSEEIANGRSDERLNCPKVNGNYCDDSGAVCIHLNKS